MHIFHSLFFFLTRTRLASQSRWYTSFMKPAAKSRVISTLIAPFLSSVNHRSFCLNGLAVVETFKECSTSSLGMTGMSAGFHVNMSTCSHRKLMSTSSYLGLRSALI